jgi:polar amino acid transport system substrate-binding protein
MRELPVVTRIFASVLAIALSPALVGPTAWAAGPVTLANDEWPPFILGDGQQGKAEKLVCEALERSGRACTVNVEDWEEVLNKARTGEIHGIAAAWRNPDRETYLLFSEPYLTNRIVPVVRPDFDAFIKSAADLRDLRVALVTDYAYGDEIAAAAASFETVPSRSSAEALAHVREGRANVALVDELVARDHLDVAQVNDLTALGTVLAFRSLHFAMSRQHPEAEEILADFHRAYEVMLSDGTVNDILEVDWLATDFGQPGNVSVVMRSGVSLDDLANPTEDGSMYALDQSEYEWMGQRNQDTSRIEYQVEGKSYSSLQSALNNVFGEQTVCEHQEYSSTFDCSNLFKSR